MIIPYVEVYRPDDLWLWKVADYVDNVAATFYDLYLAISPVWLLGQWLGWPCYVLYGWLSWVAYGLRSACYLFATVANWAVAFWNAFLRIPDLVNDVVDFFGFLYQPAVWVINRIASLYPDIWSFLAGPFEFLYRLLYPKVVDLPGLLRDPSAWVLDRVKSAWPAATHFINDPWGWLYYLILEHWSELPLFLFNPLEWVRGKIVLLWPDLPIIMAAPTGWVLIQIRQAYPEIEDFFRNPGPWMIGKVLETLAKQYLQYHDRIYDLAEKIVRYGWERKY